MMRTLVAGLGNVFEGDDGFGVAVANALVATDWPQGVELRDYGIRGVHLAYQLLDGYDLVVITDAVQRGGEPGTVYVIDHASDTKLAPPTGDAPMLDAHDLAPDGVLALVPMLGGTLGRVVVVGCEPESLAPAMGLSPSVEASIATAKRLVIEIVREAHAVGNELKVGGG
jgi:hydrogenase maturation protease